jgi:hypothetical protein
VSAAPAALVWYVVISRSSCTAPPAVATFERADAVVEQQVALGEREAVASAGALT